MKTIPGQDMVLLKNALPLTPTLIQTGARYTCQSRSNALIWEETSTQGENLHRCGENIQTPHRQNLHLRMIFFFLIKVTMKDIIWRSALVREFSRNRSEQLLLMFVGETNNERPPGPEWAVRKCGILSRSEFWEERKWWEEIINTEGLHRNPLEFHILFILVEKTRKLWERTRLGSDTFPSKLKGEHDTETTSLTSALKSFAKIPWSNYF